MDNRAIRDKWDSRYRDGRLNFGKAATVLTQHQQLLPSKARALDLASGLGANALFLAEKGLEVHAWDISPIAIEKLNLRAQQLNLTIHTQSRDCVEHPPEANSFDVIIVSHFLERDLCPAIAAALQPGGLLFYQTYTQAKPASSGPSNPNFLLAHKELLELFSELEVVAYEEGDEARFIGRKI